MVKPLYKVYVVACSLMLAYLSNVLLNSCLDSVGLFLSSGQRYSEDISRAWSPPELIYAICLLLSLNLVENSFYFALLILFKIINIPFYFKNIVIKFSNGLSKAVTNAY